MSMLVKSLYDLNKLPNNSMKNLIMLFFHMDLNTKMRLSAYILKLVETMWL